jgi:hypothetical protein
VRVGVEAFVPAIVREQDNRIVTDGLFLVAKAAAQQGLNTERRKPTRSHQETWQILGGEQSGNKKRLKRANCEDVPGSPSRNSNSKFFSLCLVSGDLVQLTGGLTTDFKSTITLFTRVRTTILAANLRAGSDCLERRFIAANVDLRSFKSVSAVEILIAYDLWSRILSTISGGRTRPQMKVA